MTRILPAAELVPTRSDPRTARSMLLALLAVGGMFALVAAATALWTFEPAPQAEEAAAVVEPVRAARLRCTTCGVIETIAHIEAKAGVPASWLFAVRLPDGSLRQSSDSQPGRWSIGDRMQLLGGGRSFSAF